MAAYDTKENADIYFENKLHTLVWSSATDSDKDKALKEATLRIDNLKFKGTKVDSDQENEFPRYYGDEADGTETVPDKIKYACFELAYTLLDEVDPELEFKNLLVDTHAFSSVRTKFDHSNVPDYLAAGIPSMLAWHYLFPYLVDGRTIKLYRAT